MSLGDTQVIGKMKLFKKPGHEYLVVGYTRTHMSVRHLGMAGIKRNPWRIECDAIDPDITFPEEWL